MIRHSMPMELPGCDRKGGRILNAVVLSFDRLHLGFLGCYGNSWIVTPNFDRLAAEAAVFDLHFGENFVTQAENHAWWTGRHQFPLTAAQQRSQPTFPRVLRQAGIRTRLVVESPLETGSEVDSASLVGHGSDISGVPSSGFDRCVPIAGRDGLDVDEADTPIARLISQGIDELHRLAAEPDVPTLLWLKSQGVPSPWIPPRLFGALYLDEFVEDDERPAATDDESAESAGEISPAAEELLEGLSEFLWSLESAIEEAGEAEPHDGGQADSAGESPDSRRDDALGEGEWPLVRAVYAGYVTLLDRWLGKLLDAIDGLAPEHRPLLIVTAAAGQSLGESRARRDQEGHLFEELVHTPLLIRLPNNRDGSVRRCELVQTIDIAPTLLDWFGLSAERFPCAGRTLLPWLRDETGRSPDAQDREFLFLGADGQEFAVRTQDLYLMAANGVDKQSDQARLFGKPDDIWEVHDIADQSLDAAEALKSALDQFLKSVTTPDAPTIDV
jgi:arylsulfatase A-like enzyme